MSDPGAGQPTRIDPDRLEELHARARALDPEARASFLADACGGDLQLERELLSLLACSDPAEAFFATLADAVASPAVGLHVGHYRLIGILGSGGMGTVYRAHDERLDRVVALKFLPPYLIAQPQARARFLLEARAAAALEHPNVCSIHEIGETTDGRPFIAMACYEGETLQERMSRGALPPAEAIRIALQLTGGLSAAHARGIIHRDVKPGNVMLTADGTARLLDFGVAKLADAGLTGPGNTPGTIAYMSPEQARGDPVDARSDLWSLGVVVYEMVSGVQPFRGGSDRAVLQAVFHDHPAPLHRRVPGTPPWLSRVVDRLMQKAPEHRYQDTHELVRDFGRGAPAGILVRARDWGQLHRRALSLAGAGVLAVLLLSWGRAMLRSTPGAASGPGPPTIAVMPFTVRGPDLELWREGMVDLLSMGLDGAGGIRAVDSRTLLARWHQAAGDQPVPDLALALAVARQSRAQYAVIGSAVAAGARIRLGADIYDVATERIVGSVQVEGSADSVLPLVDLLGMQTLGVILQRQPGDVSALDLASITTNSLLALKAYLQGEGHYRRSEFREAIEAWEGAVRADTLFALAYLGLADAYAWWASTDNTGRAKFLESLDRARATSNRLPSRERAAMEIRWAREHGIPEVLATTRDAIRKYPDAADLWYELGEIYFHDAAAMGRPEEAEAAYRQAAELQPDMAPYRAHLLDLAFAWRADSSQISHELEAYAGLVPEASKTRAGRLVFALAFGDTAAHTRAMAALVGVDPASAAMVYTFLAHPRFRRWRDEVDSILRPRLSEGDRRAATALQFKTLGLVDGRVHKALTMLDDSRTPAFLRYGGAFYLSLRGMPVPERVLVEKLGAARKDNSLFASRIGAVSAAGAAAWLGDWNAYNALMVELRALAARSLAGGDTTSAGYWDFAVRVAEAHGSWRQGRKEEALKQFESALPLDDDGWFTLWSVGQLSLELGKLEQAERAFRALWQQDGTAAYLQLARILERTGRPVEARDAYQFVADAWRYADPELQPLVDEARQAVTRLAADR